MRRLLLALLCVTLWLFVPGMFVSGRAAQSAATMSCTTVDGLDITPSAPGDFFLLGYAMAYLPLAPKAGVVVPDRALTITLGEFTDLMKVRCKSRPEEKLLDAAQWVLLHY